MRQVIRFLEGLVMLMIGGIALFYIHTPIGAALCVVAPHSARRATLPNAHFTHSQTHTTPDNNKKNNPSLSLSPPHPSHPATTA